jgi:hypothetical protein
MLWSVFPLVLHLCLLAHPAQAQFSFLVQFPIVRDARDQPHVDCSSKDYTKTPPVEYLPKTGTDPQTGNFLGSCRACTTDNYCVNQFRIKAVAFDAFTGLTTDITTCDPVDVNGNTVALGDNVYSIVLQTKAPSFSAPQGNQIKDLGGTVKVISPQFLLAMHDFFFGNLFTCLCSAIEGSGWCSTPRQLQANISWQ